MAKISEGIYIYARGPHPRRGSIGASRYFYGVVDRQSTAREAFYRVRARGYVRRDTDYRARVLPALHALHAICRRRIFLVIPRDLRPISKKVAVDTANLADLC